MPAAAPAPSPLFSVEPGRPPSLHGRRCSACGYVFFPPHDFGCESCGALPERVESMALAGAGVLRSVAVVHRHGGSSIQAPFSVGEIALDDGPMVRAVLVGDGPFAIGDRVRSRLWSVQARPALPPGDDRGLWSRTVNAEAGVVTDSQPRFELRFEKAVA
jgi:uncharacterized OB-fold protein